MPRTGTNKSGSALFYYIHKGQVCRGVSAETPGAVNRPKEDGSARYETRESWIIGKVHRIARKKGDENFKDKIVLFLSDGDEYFSLDFPVGGYFNSFLQRLKTLDFTKPIRFEPYYFQEEKRVKMGFYQEMDGKWEKILPFFYKDNMNGVPEPKQVEVNGKTVWDFTEQKKHLFDILLKEVFPVIGQSDFEIDHDSNSFSAVFSKQNEAPKDTKAASEEVEPEEEDDDLPF